MITDKRSSGILLPISSLPSPYGIGTLGKAAYEFIDFLKKAGQSYWQILPIGPCGYADSPYQSFSAFAGNPYFIDPDALMAEGLLTRGELNAVRWGTSAAETDYSVLYRERLPLLYKAFLRFRAGHADELAAYAQRERDWLPDYALFMAVKKHFGDGPWTAWPEDIRLRRTDAVARYRAALADEIDFQSFLQYEFDGQWRALMAYAHEKGIKIIGDIPIYVPLDSADVWRSPENFLLKRTRRPRVVAGCPPDAFTRDGQYWGNPIYDWERMEKDGFPWWLRRIGAAAKRFDVVRFDHFRGLESYWSIPAENKTARRGHWEKGPGRAFIDAVRGAFPDMDFIAEDLGYLTPEVVELVKYSGFPGMKVLEFAFDPREPSEYLPYGYDENCVCYTGTHDNETLIQWCAGQSAEVTAYARDYLGIADGDDLCDAIIRAGMNSRAGLFVAQLQDYLRLGAEARMNYPGHLLPENWRWRLTPGQADDALAEKIRALTESAERIQDENRPLDPQKLTARTQELLCSLYGDTLSSAAPHRLHECLGRACMEGIDALWRETEQRQAAGRRAFYFSAEYLVGRLVYSNLFNLGILDEVKAAFAEKGVDLACLEDIEDAALGNGGLGRLAACFLDSAATCGLPLTGYGLRYKYGLFKQSFDETGRQFESPDDWTKNGDPWSVRRDGLAVTVPMADGDAVCVPYDMPVIGYQSGTVGTLRLWQCDEGEITHVLYPDDSDEDGKRLRIRQQYVLSSASLQDILRHYRRVHGDELSELAAFTAVQLNDTHPAMSIPELIRLLMADGMAFEDAFALAQQVFAYTNHTVMGEALEKWDMALLRSVVPEVCDVIVLIDEKLKRDYPGSGLYIINDGRVHMANLSVYVSSAVNGVAEIHSEILKNDLFRDWYALFPERFQNKTNGITPRRWLGLSDPELCALFRSRIGGGFLTDLTRLEGMKAHLDDETVRQFNAVKQLKKQQLCDFIAEREGIRLDPGFIFDVQIKRLHEYKRQLLNALCIADLYLSIKDGTLTDFPPTVFLFGAKAAPGYVRAKSVIRYINRLAALINGDPAVDGLMKIVFVQDYNCSYAEHIIPAADISEQISPAGTEASGTGNMKLMLNGAVTLGTLDGANVEIVREAGRDNNYVFGATVEELKKKSRRYRARSIYKKDARVKRAVDTLIDGTVETDEGLRELYTSLLDGASWHKADHYFILYEFESYRETKLRALRDCADRLSFGRKGLINAASAGLFSSDRTVRQYAEEIWKI